MNIGMYFKQSTRMRPKTIVFALALAQILMGSATAQVVDYDFDPDKVVTRILSPNPQAYSNFGQSLTLNSHGHIAASSKIWQSSTGNPVRVFDSRSGELLAEIPSSTKRFVTQLLSLPHGNLVVVYRENVDGPGGILVFSPNDYTAPIFSLTGIPAEHQIGLSHEKMSSVVAETGFYVSSKVGVYTFEFDISGDISQGEIISSSDSQVGLFDSIGFTADQRLIVGKPYVDTSVIDSSVLPEGGEVQLFDISINADTQEKQFSPGLIIANPEPQENAHFGDRVIGLSNGHIAILAPGYKAESQNSAIGKIYVFDDQGNLINEIEGPPNLSFANAPLKFRESTDGTLLIGNKLHTAYNEGISVGGAVLEYSLLSGEEIYKYIPPDNHTSHSFGYDFSLLGDDVCVGHPNYAIDKGLDTQVNFAGSVYCFSNTPTLNAFIASPESIESGELVNLSWNVSGNATVTITQRSVLDGATATELPVTEDSSQISVMPPGSAIYEITLYRDSNIIATDTVTVHVTNSDWDNDGLSDAWELNNQLDPLASNAEQDPDSDGLTNLQEFELGTIPTSPDSDGDTLSDGLEVQLGLNPIDKSDIAQLLGDDAYPLDASSTPFNYVTKFNPPTPDNNVYFGSRINRMGNGNIVVAPSTWKKGNANFRVYYGDTLASITNLEVPASELDRLVQGLDSLPNGDLVVVYQEFRYLTNGSISLANRYVEVISGEDYKTVKFKELLNAGDHIRDVFANKNGIFVGISNGSANKINTYTFGVDGAITTGSIINNGLNIDTAFGVALSETETGQLIVGESQYRVGSSSVGRVHLFDFNGTEYTLSKTIDAPSQNQNSGFGAEVLGLSDGRVLIHSAGELQDDNINKGIVYVYNPETESLTKLFDSPFSNDWSADLVEGINDDAYFVSEKVKVDEKIFVGAVFQYSLVTGEKEQSIYPPVGDDLQASGSFASSLVVQENGQLIIGQRARNHLNDDSSLISKSGVFYRYAHSPINQIKAQLGFFTSSERLVDANTSVTLSWSVSGIGEVVLEQASVFSDGELSSISLEDGVSSINVSPTASKKYILKLIADGNVVASRALTVMVNGSDSDGDGMPDDWELEHNFNPLVNDALEDFDNDFLTNLEEYQFGLDPRDNDSNNDGKIDGVTQPVLQAYHSDYDESGILLHDEKVDEDDLVDDQYRLSSQYLELVWGDNNGADYFLVRWRNPGEDSWRSEQTTLKRFEQVHYDQDNAEYQVAACNVYKCSEFGQLDYSFFFDLPEVGEGTNRLAYQTITTDSQESESTNVCLIGAEDNSCSKTLDISFLSSIHGVQTTLLQNGEPVANLHIENLSRGIHTYYVTELPLTHTRDNVLARKRFYVYTAVEGNLATDQCTFSSDSSLCLADINWQYRGQYPVCLFETTASLNEEVWCGESGENSGVNSFSVDLSERTFELRAKEPAGERVMSSVSIAGAFEGVSLDVASETCAMFTGDVDCDMQISWTAAPEYNACLFRNDTLLSCSSNGVLNIAIPLGWNDFELRNGNSPDAPLMASARVRASYFASGELELVDPSTNGMCTIEPGETRCTIPTITRHWYAPNSGVHLYKNGEPFTSLGLSSQTAQQQTWQLYAEEGGTTWSMHVTENGVERELARIDLLTTTFALQGYALRAPNGKSCELDPTVFPFQCEIRIEWDVPEYDVCLFKVGRDDHGEPACPTHNFTAGDAKLTAGTHVYQLRKGDKDPEGELVAQIQLVAEEKIVNTLSISQDECTVGEGKPDCIVTANIFTNDPGNICLYLDDQPIDGFCHLSRNSEIKHTFNLVGNHTYRLVRVGDNGSVTELDSAQITGTEAFVRNFDLSVTPTDCYVGEGFCDLNIQAYSNFETCLSNGSEEITFESGEQICLDETSIESPLSTSVRLNEGSHVIRLLARGPEGFFTDVVDSVSIQNSGVRPTPISTPTSVPTDTSAPTITPTPEPTPTMAPTPEPTPLPESTAIPESDSNDECDLGDDIGNCQDQNGRASNGDDDIITYTGPDLSLTQIKMLPPTFAEIEIYDEPVNPEVMSIANPNSAGISVNRFDHFIVDSTPLNIVNQISNDVDRHAKLIVIIADSITLKNRIEVVGRYADILFVSENSDGSIRCDNCGFRNFYRIGMVVNDGPMVFSEGDDFIGKLNSSEQGLIDIRSLYAPGVIGLDLLAGSVNTDGIVDLNTRVSITEAGSYQTDVNGDHRIGSGAINIMAGQFIWQYDAQTLVDYTKGSNVSSLNGHINASSIKLSASSPVTVQAKIDTLNHLRSSISYGGYTHLPSELVQLVNYTEQPLKLEEAHVVSKGALNIKSLSDLNLSQDSILEAHTVSLIAGNTINQKANIFADLIDFGGESVFNRGQLHANTEIKGWADQYLVNQYGGEILADTVILQTDMDLDSYILNGSRTPYESFDTSLLPVGSDYYDSANHAKLGIYYAIGLDDDVLFSDEVRPEKTHAHIRARHLEVKTNAFENINPFYQVVDGRLIPLQRKYHTQVTTIAEELLKVEADDYILNSSSFLGVQKESGLVQLKANLIFNERYRVLSIQDFLTFSSSEIVEIAHSIEKEVDTTSEVLLTKIGVYSPPGILFSMGNFEASAQELFLNSMGYFEIFGNADIASASLHDVGMSHRTFQRDVSVRPSFSYFNTLIHMPIESIVQTDPEQSDSLFYVKGMLKATAVENLVGEEKQQAVFREYDPFNAYAKQIIEDKLAAHYDFSNIETGPTFAANPSAVQDYSWYWNVSHEVDWEHYEFTVDWFWSYSFFDATPYLPLAQQHVERQGYAVDTFDLIEEFEALYESIKDSVIEFLDTVTWWN